jgi:hypothetical protein
MNIFQLFSGDETAGKLKDFSHDFPVFSVIFHHQSLSHFPEFAHLFCNRFSKNYPRKTLNKKKAQSSKVS